MAAPFISYATSARSTLESVLIRGIERLTGRAKMEAHYASTENVDAEDLWGAALAEFSVTLDVSPSNPADVIPAEGPVVVVANHPFGILDGLALCHIVSRVRTDFRILVNRVLCGDERVDEYFLPIDFSGTGAGQRMNVCSMKAAFDQLHAGGVVMVFPSGGVATARSPFGAVEDLPWKPMVARLIQRAQVPIVPVHFEGQNSRLFQIASHLSFTLRLALLLREALRKEGDRLAVQVRSPIPYDAVARFPDREALVAHLRRVTLGADRDDRPNVR